MTARDFSQMPVQSDTEEQFFTRCVRRKGHALQRGSYVDVEVGAIWATILHVRLCPHPHLDTAPDVFG